jgi:hypothetical protein
MARDRGGCLSASLIENSSRGGQNELWVLRCFEEEHWNEAVRGSKYFLISRHSPTTGRAQSKTEGPHRDEY